MKRKLLSALIILFMTSGISYSDSLKVESDKQEFKDSDSKIYLEGDVKVQKGNVNVLSPHAVVEVDPKTNKVKNVEFGENAYTYQLDKGKKHEIKAQILKMSLLNNVYTAEGKSISSITENDKPVVIVTADKQEYNKNTNVMKAYGSVNILYKDVTTYSDTAVVDLTKDNDVKVIRLIGHAKLKKDKSNINADSLVYDNIKELAVATGKVYSKTITEDNKTLEVWSDHQEYNKKTNFVSASGSTKIHYDDYHAKGPKVNVYPDKNTGKLNEAVFVGRSVIETKGRTVEADRISIIMNPKDFKAEGHVVSIIPDVGKN